MCGCVGWVLGRLDGEKGLELDFREAGGYSSAYLNNQQRSSFSVRLRVLQVQERLRVMLELFHE